MNPNELRESIVNCNAGPSPLPLAALLEASSSLLSFPATPGVGIAEISHRSPAFLQIITQAEADLRSLLAIPSNYKVLWMQGGGLTQFSATALNLLAAYRLKHKLGKEEEVVGEYVVTGSWSLKAAEEGARMGAVARTILDARVGGKFTSIPPLNEWNLAASAIEDARRPAFVYYCDNETVDGVEFPTDDSEGGQPFPFDAFHEDVPIVCDMSSNFLSRPVDVSKYGIIYAGAQKNLGPAGVSVVIVREDLIVDTDLALPYGGPSVPSMLSYKNMADSGSMYNTPPTFTIYVCALVLRTLLATPPFPLLTPTSAPLSPLAQLAHVKSTMVYNLIEQSDSFYRATAQTGSRSRMNVTFRLKGEGKERDEREKRFIKKAESEGIVGVAGHRSVGGIRTSIYNAVTIPQVEKLAAFMTSFMASELSLSA